MVLCCPKMKNLFIWKEIFEQGFRSTCCWRSTIRQTLANIQASKFSLEDRVGPTIIDTKFANMRQTSTVCYSWLLHVKSTHRNKFAYLVFIIFGSDHPLRTWNWSLFPFHKAPLFRFLSVESFLQKSLVKILFISADSQ